MQMNPRVLIIDDDPSDLELHGMIARRAGFEPIPVLARLCGLDPVPGSKIDLILLDYRMNSLKTSQEIAQEIRSKFPETPIILLSDFWSSPPDMAPFVTQFIRKGEPAKLLEALCSHLPARDAAIS